MDELNPQAEQMASEAMVRTLAAQAQALWPLEAPLFDRYPVPDGGNILDVGCGTGEITIRVADRFPTAAVMGVDLHEPHLQRARKTAAPRSNVQFDTDNAFELNQPDAHFDLVLFRHVIQSLPQPTRSLDQLYRVCKPGGRVHIVAEDYGMMHFGPTKLDADRFWREGPWRFADGIDNDLRIGRKMLAYLRAAGFVDVTVDYLVADTLRVDRDLLALIWEAWRDGYTDPVVQNTDLTREEVTAHWNDMIATIRDPDGYALWQVPVWSAGRP